MTKLRTVRWHKDRCVYSQTAGVTNNKTGIFFLQHLSAVLRWSVVCVCESFISRRSDSDSSGLFRCDPECPHFPERDTESTQHCQISGLLCCSRHAALTSLHCDTTGATQNQKLGGKKKQDPEHGGGGLLQFPWVTFIYLNQTDKGQRVKIGSELVWKWCYVSVTNLKNKQPLGGVNNNSM